MIARCIVLAGMVALTGLAFESATAQDEATGAFPQQSALEGIRFNDISDPPGFEMSWGESRAARYSRFQVAQSQSTLAETPEGGGARRYEATLTVPTPVNGLDVSLSHRTALTVDRAGDIGGTSSGAEVRVGRNLARLVRPWNVSASEQSSWYIFLASDGQALTWTPESAALVGQRGLRLQDRVTIGDTQVGIGYDFGMMQASLGYTQREITYDRARGLDGIDQREDFVGVMFSIRR
ncbi:MAG: hypothetical protein JNJ73_01725 [Hyphomonadaceae bacterium]|nr:hypothetical protein [Hyphomonadaceae bacterium]